MAEFAIVATIIQIADVGLRLSLKLYTFGETMANADRTIISISKDISLTSSVLKELGHNLEKDKQARICTENAIKTAEEVVQECLRVFQEIDGMLEKTMASTGQAGTTKAKWTSAVLGKLKWPFLQPKMQLLRSNLDKLKATLLLMLNVMTYAQQLSERSHQTSQLEDHRKLIEDLARSKDDYTGKFDALTRAIAASSTNEGSTEIQPFDDPPASPDWFPSTPREDHASGILYELKIYGALINRLLRSIHAVDRSIEPLVGTRIRDDVLSTHRREASRYETLHGRSRLRAALTGLAWDVMETELEAETYQPSEPDSKLPSLQLPGAVFPHNATANDPQSSDEMPRKTVDELDSDPIGFFEGEDVPSPPIVQSRRSASSGDISLHSTPGALRSINALESLSRNRSKSPIGRGSVMPSPSMSEGSASYMDRATEADFSLPIEFEVKEQDGWLPIANVARIMKNALPQNAKFTKEAKECMQECVSEFISFITSEAAEKRRHYKRKTIEGEDIVFALNSLGFENYAELLNIYRAGYRRTVHGEITSELPRSSQTGNPSATILTEPAPEGTKDAPTTKQDAPCGENTHDDQAQKDRYGESHLQNSGQNTHEAEPRSIVDDLLLQWTSLPAVR